MVFCFPFPFSSPRPRTLSEMEIIKYHVAHGIWTMLHSISWEKKKSYKMCQALEYYPLKQIPNKQCQVIVFKGFMQEEREKTCMPKEQGRGNPASCPKHIQGLSGLNALKDGKSISSVGFRVWPLSEWTLFSSYWVGIACGSRLCLLSLFHHRLLWVLLYFGTSPVGGISRSIKTMTL